MRAGLLVLLWLCAISFPAYGQEAAGPEERVLFKHFTVEDGLPQEDVHALFEDSLGFLWIGTEDGLSRYDGHGFRTFRPTPFDTTSLSGAWVVGLANDGDGGLWVATETGGLNHYDARTESFVHIPPEATAPDSLGTHNLWVLLRARDGALWLGARGDGLTRYDPSTGAVIHYTPDPSRPDGLSRGNVRALAEDEAGRIWIGVGEGGLDRLDPTTGAIARYRHDLTDLGSLPHDGVEALRVDREGTLWIGTGRGMARYDPVADRFDRVRTRSDDGSGLNSAAVTALLDTPDGRLWIGTNRGLYRFDAATGTAVRFRHDPADPTSLGAGAVHTLHLDRSGVLWVGTASGLSRYAWGAPHFPLITHDPATPNGLSDPGVWSFFKDADGTVWVGTQAGLDRFDAATGAATHFRHDPSDPASLTPGWVVSLFEDAEGTFGVGTRRDGVRPGGLNRFDRATGRVVERFVENPADPTSLPSDNPWRLFEDSAGRLWVLSGGTGCLSLMDRTADTFTPFCNDPRDSNTPSYDAAKGVAEHPDGVLWLATWGGGLDRFDTRAGTWTHFRHDPEDLNTPADDYILDLYKDRDDVLWLGTYGGGLDRFDPATETFTHFTEATSGLPNDVVYAIEGDEEGNVWVSTNRGLARLDPATEHFRVFGLENGLQNLEFNAGASHSAPDGELFFGGIDGFNRFYPDRITEDAVPPPVVLTGLSIRGQPVAIGDDSPLAQALPYTRELRLHAAQRDLSFTFAALDFVNPESNRYRYRLEGYDEEWRTSGSEQTATYTNLDPGRYTFRVQAATSAGVWSEDGAALGVVVASPWWATWWATLGYASLVLGAGVVLYRNRRDRRERQHRLEIERIEAEQLRELDRARSRFFANVSHEFRTPLTLTIGPLDDVRTGLYGALSPEVDEQLALAQRNAGRVLALINQILDVARLEAGRMQLRARCLDLGAFVAGVAQAFVPLADRKGISLDVQGLEAGAEVWADPEQLQKVFANLLSNALKYTPTGGAVRVTVRAETDVVHTVVRDSGPGISEADLPHVFERFYRVDESNARRQPGTGIGLALVKELVDLHGGTITVKSEAGFGSRFTVTLRRGQTHLRPEDIVEDEPLEAHLAFDGLIESLPMADAPTVSRDGALDRIGSDDEDDGADDVTTVLVVEDNAELRAYVRRHLAPAYRVVEAADGAEGLAMARDLLPDLVLSDVMMPEMDGFALLAGLRADPETDFLPVVLLTARAEAEDRLGGLGLGADDYLTKPFDVRELRARVDNLIAGRQRLRERYAATGPSAADSTAAAGIEPLRPSPVDVDSDDAVFLEQVRAAIEAHLGDETFTVERLAEAVAVSRGHLHRKLKVLAGQTPSEAIQAFRIERGSQLLAAGAGTVSEVAYAVGFKSVSHFSNRFEKAYGHRPSQHPTAS